MIDQRAFATLRDLGCRTALFLYVLSIPFSNVTLFLGMSLSVPPGIAFFALKLLGLAMERRAPRLAPEIAAIGILVGYLVIKELLVFGVELRRDYFGSVVLNLVMCAALLDEFRSRKNVAVQAAAVFSAVIAIISITVLLGLGRQLSGDGRATFLGINENELALSFLVSFTFLAVFLTGNSSSSKTARVVCYILSCAIIVALIGTGTRFAFFMLVMQLVVLLGYHLYNAIGRREGWLDTSMTVSWLSVVVVATASSQTMIVRLNPALGVGRADSSGLMGLGGRLGLWDFAFDAFQRSPLFGFGRQGYEQLQLAEGQSVSLPHNLALEVAALGGLIGLAILGVLVVQILWRVLQGAVSDRPALVLMAFPLASAVLFLNIVPVKVVWFLLALFIARRYTDGNFPRGRYSSHFFGFAKFVVPSGSARLGH